MLARGRELRCCGVVLDRVWISYLLAALAMTAPVAWLDASPTGAAEGCVQCYAALHLGLLVGVSALRVGFGSATGANADRSGLIARTVFTLVAVPTVFLSIGWVLPAVHPEPFAWTFLASDRWLLGLDPTVALGRWLSPPLVELLQVAYSLFYLLPVIAVLGVGHRRGRRAFEQGLLVVTAGFLLSYLGYFLWPTLPPYRFLTYEQPLRGLWLAESVRTSLDSAELHRWNCFPSGHTMLSLLSVWVARGAARWLLAVIAVVAGVIVISTLALRYHYLSDVLAGCVGAVVVAVAGETWLRVRPRPA